MKKLSGRQTLSARRVARIAAALAVVVAGTLTAAATGTTATRGVGAAIPNGGTVTFRLSSAPDCLDPQRTSQSASFQIFDPVFDTLVRVDTHGKYIGYLASKWTITHGGKWMTFYLQHGLRFSNGDPLTASSVKFTFDRALAPSTNSPVSGGELKGVTKTVVLNPYTVRLVLNAPNRPLLGNLAEAYLGILDPKALQKEGPAKFCQFPVGSGPFFIKSIGPGFSTIVLARNPYHTFRNAWASNQGPAHLQQLVFKLIPDEGTGASAVITGEIDVDGFDVSQQSRFAGQSNIYILNIPATAEDWLGMNVSSPPLDNVAVRRAVASVIDRATIVKVARNGQGPAEYSPIPALMPFHDPKAKSHAAPFDPAGAAKVFAANNVTSLDLVFQQGTRDELVGQLVQSWLGQAGVHVNLLEKDGAGYNAALQAGQDNLYLNGWGCSDPDCMAGFFDPAQTGPGGENFVRENDPTLNALFAKGRQATTQQAAAAAYSQIQFRINDMAYVVPLYDFRSLYAITRRVHGFKQGTLGDQIWQDLWVTGS